MEMSKETHRPAAWILTREELAIYLRVAGDALQPLIDSGQIPGRRIGSEWRFLRPAVDEWLRAPAVPAPPPAAAVAPHDWASAEPENAPRAAVAPPIEWVGAAANNYGTGRQNQAIKAVVNHVMLGTLDSTSSWFNNSAAEVSANYGIGQDGRIVQFVRDTDTAYANGPVYAPNTAATPWIATDHANGLDMNTLTISIEWEGMHKGGRAGRVAWNGQMLDVALMKDSVKTFWVPGEAQYQAGLALIRYLCAKYNLTPDRAHIGRHSDFDSVRKWFCPGEGFPLQRLLNDLAPAPAGPADFPLLHAPSVSQAAFTAALVAAHSPVLAETDTPVLYGICTANGVDPAVALAFFGQETAYGTQDGAADNKNWGNLWDHAAGAIGSYPTWQQGLVDWCSQLQHPPYPSPATVRAIVPIHRGTDRADNDAYAAAVIARIQALAK